MSKKYKRKFLVEGDTLVTCGDLCKRRFPLPCSPKRGALGRDERLCPYKIQVHKPRQYIVAETEDGDWQCNCPRWKFRREECHHIQKAKADPKRYEIDVEWTGRTTDVIKKVLQ